MSASLDKRCSQYIAPVGVRSSNLTSSASIIFIAILLVHNSRRLKERVPRRQKRGFITLLVTVLPLILKESIYKKVFFTA